MNKLLFNGVFAVHKPTGMLSGSVVKFLDLALTGKKPILEKLATAQKVSYRNRLKIGHGGTLDPLASGVLIIGLGTGCKQLQQYLSCTKVYEATGILGSATDTYDSCGQVTRVAPFEHVTSEKFEKCLEQFRGEITQIPPIYSALRMQGVRLYDYARKGLPLPAEIKARPVKIHSLESLEFTSKHSYNTPNNGILAETSSEPCTPPIFRIRVACGGGTYIRSLIYDIGEQLDSAAHMVQLKRTEQGGFVLGKDTLELEECCDIDKIRDAINHSESLLSQK